MHRASCCHLSVTTRYLIWSQECYLVALVKDVAVVAEAQARHWEMNQTHNHQHHFCEYPPVTRVAITRTQLSITVQFRAVLYRPLSEEAPLTIGQ